MTDDYLGRIGNLIRDARKHRGYTQSQLAAQLGTSQSAINRIERGHQNLSLEMLARIGEALDFMEAWATVTVAFDLLAELADCPMGADDKGQRFLRHVQALNLTSRARMGLTEDERSSPAFRQAVEDMRAFLARQDARLASSPQPSAG